MTIFSFSRIMVGMHTIIPTLLPLERPLIVFDLETTGLTFGEDRILELAYEKIQPSGEILSAVHRFHPGRTIPPEASAINGIFDRDVAESPSFAKRSYELWNMFDGADFAGFNILGFDLPFLKAEFALVGKKFEYLNKRIVDVKILYHSKEPKDMFTPRNLSAAYKLYCGKEHTTAHTGAGDVRVTVEILEQQLERYPEFRDWKNLTELHGNGILLESAETEHSAVVPPKNALF